ncbi:dynactin subunit 3-like [Xenia sp. Carnegie-2017]|uniref:dynactin subunit 3-like n=1 Tax=Xenia sp. Carnegie-2017 TaxID=2897299 RepID=UPI001F03DABD|nr:dynactin subunit 3-like [Xenia sp. Carnegie-2017]
MADTESLVSLEDRIAVLERRIISSHPNKNNNSCIDMLTKVQQDLNKIATRYSKLGLLWKRLNELQEYLTPEFLEKLKLTDDAKTDIILADEKNLLDAAKQLEILDKLKNVPSEATFKDIPEWSEKLQPLIQVNLQQLEDLNTLDEEICNLTTTYNKIIVDLSNQFKQWENIICELEEEAQKSHE